MKGAGVIATYMSRQDWQGKKFLLKVRAIFFNCKLFIVQLMFMIAGTAYGKIKWPKLERWQDRAIGVIFMWAFIPFMWFFPKWWSIPILIIGAFIGIATFRYIDWRRVWRAAQVSHVRLCLKELPYSFPSYREGLSRWQYINFGYPEAELQYWRMDECDGRRFEYRSPTFNPSPEFIKAMQQYAYDQVDKGYDDLQLISSGLHLIAWIVMPWRWGKELKIIKALNRPGGREHCISGLTACLRWGEYDELKGAERWNMLVTSLTIFFKGYSTATTFPCLVELSENWREKDE